MRVAPGLPLCLGVKASCASEIRLCKASYRRQFLVPVECRRRRGLCAAAVHLRKSISQAEATLNLRRELQITLAKAIDKISPVPPAAGFDTINLRPSSITQFSPHALQSAPHLQRLFSVRTNKLRNRSPSPWYVMLGATANSPYTGYS